MSQLPPEPTAVPGEDDTTLGAGVPGPSGTGELTDAGADPAAPSRPAPTGPAPTGPASGATTGQPS